MINLSKTEIQNLTKFEKKSGLDFRRKELLCAALCHPSYVNGREGEGLEDFERLEFFGDSILSFVVTERLLSLFPTHDEGRLTHLRAACVSRKFLAKIAQKIELHKHIIYIGGEKSEPLEKKAKILADSFEALIAAVYLDRGLKSVRLFILQHFGSYLTPQYLGKIGKSPKNDLQELSQRLHNTLPKYEMVAIDRNLFRATARIGDLLEAEGEGCNKKTAQEKAANALLRKIKNSNKKSSS